MSPVGVRSRVTNLTTAGSSSTTSGPDLGVRRTVRGRGGVYIYIHIRLLALDRYRGHGLSHLLHFFCDRLYRTHRLSTSLKLKVIPGHVRITAIGSQFLECGDFYLNKTLAGSHAGSSQAILRVNGRADLTYLTKLKFPVRGVCEAANVSPA